MLIPEFFATGALEHEHLPALDGGVPLQARGATVHSERRHPNSCTVLHYPEDRPLRSKTCAANDTVELYCPWCESLPLTATALRHGNPMERVFNCSYHDFLVVWGKVIEATRLGDSTQPLVPYRARHSGPSIDAALGTRTRKEIKDRGRWKSDRSVL